MRRRETGTHGVELSKRNVHLALHLQQSGGGHFQLLGGWSGRGDGDRGGVDGKELLGSGVGRGIVDVIGALVVLFFMLFGLLVVLCGVRCTKRRQENARYLPGLWALQR